ncbi:MAG: type secretion system protein [Frankiales bacterium]|nr:type secretion system protein [Frankiales bacterium]
MSAASTTAHLATDLTTRGTGPTTFLSLLAGAGVGLGLLLLTVGIRGQHIPTPTEEGSVIAAVSRRHDLNLRRLGGALGAGLLVLAVTRWIAAAVGVALLVGYAEQVFGGTRRSRDATARLEALAGWTESLRDLVATGIALPEALPASVSSAAPAIAPHLLRLADRISAREPLEPSLRALGDELDDGGADLVVAALLLNTRAQGRALEAVLSSLALSLRGELRVRRTIEAERRSTRRAVQIVIAVTLLTALGLSVGNPTYVQPYQSVTGQLVLAIVVAIFGIGFAWLSRLSALPSAPRILPASSPIGGRS